MTLRNFGALLVVMIALFTAVELVARHRRPAPTDYGRLVGQQFPTDTVATRAPEVVTEGAIDDQTAPDPMLLEPAARAQYLGSPQLTPTQAQPPGSTTAAPVVGRAEGGAAVVGQGSDVAIAKSPTVPLPKLSGGIFKEQQ